MDLTQSGVKLKAPGTLVYLSRTGALVLIFSRRIESTGRSLILRKTLCSGNAATRDGPVNYAALMPAGQITWSLSNTVF